MLTVPDVLAVAFAPLLRLCLARQGANITISYHWLRFDSALIKTRQGGVGIHPHSLGTLRGAAGQQASRHVWGPKGLL